MSSGEVKKTEATSVIEHRTVEYLQAHPDFFTRHPELLIDLEVPHSCGNAVSLVEYQVSVLRDQTHQLRQKLQGLLDNARDNEDLSQRLHRLTMELVACKGVDQIFATLYETLREDFSADKVVVRLFAEPRFENDAGLAEFVGPDEGGARLFKSLFKSSYPVCGRLKREQAIFLFGDEVESICSGLLLPLAAVEGFGVLAIGSRDERRFQPGMGTVFLRHLGEVAGRLIRPYVHIP